MKFNRYWGPPAGAICGFLVGLRAGARQTGGFEWQYVIYATIAGAVAGCLILLIDSPAKSSRRRDSYEVDSESVEAAELTEEPESLVRVSIIGKLLSILGLLFVILPPIGIVLSLIALVLSWRAGGWPKIVAWIGFILSALLIGILVLSLA